MTGTTPLASFTRRPEEEMVERARAFRDELRRRRTVREYSSEDVPDGVVELAIETAASAPSGANRQPWHFAVVRDPEIKRRIREAAEAEERELYAGRAPAEWLEALAPLGTDGRKEFLERAPVLVAVFAEAYAVDDGRKAKHYYVRESVGIAVGFLIAALHHAGLATLTHTPSPMGFLNEILGRPQNERPYLLLVVGYPAPDATVPVLTKKSLAEVASFR